MANFTVRLERRNFSRGSRQRWRRGGTLLEVLMSLLVLSMLLQTVVQVSTQVRSAKRLARDSTAGRNAAIDWRMARERGDAWARGDGGNFPDDGIRWQLSAVASSGDVTRPDERWRTLELMRSDASASFFQTVLRLENSIDGDPSGAAPRPSPAMPGLR